VARCLGMRKPRLLRAGALYHVYARANNQELVLAHSVRKALFLKMISRAHSKFHFTIENFTIMGNHYHLLIRPERDSCLSRIMQWIMSVFAVALNRILKRTGHVWGERFSSSIISSFRSFLESFAYIDNNPVKAGLTDRADKWLASAIWHRRHGYRGIVGQAPLYITMFFPGHTLLLIADAGCA
jgi:putative transposase